MSSVPETLEPGTILSNRYQVEYVLGRGGMGAVYLARDQQQNLAVAVKEMRVQPGDEHLQRQAIEQFRQEAQFLSVLDHPNLVKVFDFFVQDGRYYLVMSYVPGRTLRELLRTQTEFFPLKLLMEWTVQLVDVLHYLHSQNPPILFRDVKPSNIIVDAENRLRLIDFGIARCFHPDEATATFLQGMGSADYCPLEQYQGVGGTDQRSDIYSLGATLYHLLTLKVPPRAGELAAENKKVPSPRMLNPSIEPALEDLVVNMMAVYKQDRYGSMTQVRNALQKVNRNLELREERAAASTTSRRVVPVSELPIKPGSKSQQQQTTTMILAALTAVMLFLMGWLVTQMSQSGSTPSPTPKQSGSPSQP
ncbi:serine/threonine protein kinase [bacterium]|nr:serine/threonine protein kinase [bacterium]